MPPPAFGSVQQRSDGGKYTELPTRPSNLIPNSGIRLISQLKRLRTLTNPAVLLAPILLRGIAKQTGEKRRRPPSLGVTVPALVVAAVSCHDLVLHTHQLRQAGPELLGLLQLLFDVHHLAGEAGGEKEMTKKWSSQQKPH